MKKKPLDDYFAKAGFALAGGMWGDAYWKKLGPKLVVSISDLFQNAPEKLDDWCVITIYAPTTDEEMGWFAEFNPGSGNADGPSLTVALQVECGINEALKVLAALVEGFKSITPA